MVWKDERLGRLNLRFKWKFQRIQYVPFPRKTHMIVFFVLGFFLVGGGATGLWWGITNRVVCNLRDVHKCDPHPAGVAGAVLLGIGIFIWTMALGLFCDALCVETEADKQMKELIVDPIVAAKAKSKERKLNRWITKRTRSTKPSIAGEGGADGNKPDLGKLVQMLAARKATTLSTHDLRADGSS